MSSLSTQPSTALPALQANRKVLIPIFLGVVFLYWIALYLYVPTLPLYMQSKTPDLALIGSALSMYGLWQVISRLPLGIGVDWVGRSKPFIIALLVLVAIGDLVLGTAPNIGSAIVGRALIGAAAGCWVPLVVLFGSLYAPKDLLQATALISMVGTFGRITATVANGWLNNLGGYPLAFKVAAVAALIGAAVMVFLPSVATPRRHPSPARLLRLARRGDVMLPSLVQALVHVGDFAATFTFIPILARLHGASDVVVGLLQSSDLGVALVGNLISARLVERLGKRQVVGLGLAFITAGILGAAAASTLFFVFLSQVSIGFGFGVVYPLLMGMSIRYVDHSERSTAMGIHQSIYSVGMFAGPWLSGILASHLGMPVMFVIIAGLLFVGGFVGVWRLGGIGGIKGVAEQGRVV